MIKFLWWLLFAVSVLYVLVIIPTIAIYEAYLRYRLRKITPPNSVLLEMVKKSGPPEGYEDWPEEEKPW